MPFRIRSEQVDVFTRRLEVQFAKRMANHLRITFPREVEKLGVDDEGLEQLALRGLANARKYRVVNESDVRRYIECMVILGPHFDCDEQFPWAAQSLRRTDLDGEAKMDQIDEHLIYDLRVGC
ncbi:MAG: hypothetical protein ABSH35_20125 [Isosphaeraceae bacterium]